MYALYGVDIPKTFFDPLCPSWNIGNMQSIRGSLLNKMQTGKIPGIHKPFAYYGSYGSSFAWHTEDSDLLAINYLHFGEPKVWLILAPQEGLKLEKLLTKHFPKTAQSCPHFWRHKTFMTSPDFLRNNNIDYKMIVQRAGDFVVTFPYVYHSGFNLGFNLAEAVNYANQHWAHYGLIARQCQCSSLPLDIPVGNLLKSHLPNEFKRLLDLCKQNGYKLPHPDLPQCMFPVNPDAGGNELFAAPPLPPPPPTVKRGLKRKPPTPEQAAAAAAAAAAAEEAEAAR